MNPNGILPSKFGDEAMQPLGAVVLRGVEPAPAPPEKTATEVMQGLCDMLVELVVASPGVRAFLEAVGTAEKEAAAANYATGGAVPAGPVYLVNEQPLSDGSFGSARRVSRSYDYTALEQPMRQHFAGGRHNSEPQLEERPRIWVNNTEITPQPVADGTYDDHNRRCRVGVRGGVMVTWLTCGAVDDFGAFPPLPAAGELLYCSHGL